MGFNTTIVLLNDAFYEYENNPQRLIDEIREVMAFHDRDRGQPMIFGHTHHADSYMLLMVGGNMAQVLATSGYCGTGMLDQQLHILKEAAANLGYRLIRKHRRQQGERRKT